MARMGPARRWSGPVRGGQGHRFRWVVGAAAVGLTLAGCSASGADEPQFGERIQAWSAADVALPGGVDAATTDHSAVDVAQVAQIGDELMARIGGSPAAVTIRSLSAGSGKSTTRDLYSSPSQGPLIPASVGKVVTAATALDLFGASETFTTRVVAGSDSSELVLIGGGDPVLADSNNVSGTRLAPMSARPASLKTLAQRVARAIEPGEGTALTVYYDDSVFIGSTVGPAWPSQLIPAGIVSAITGLVAGDGGTAPSEAAATAFARHLREALPVQSVAVDLGGRIDSTVAPGPDIAHVTSPPVSAITNHILTNSDNTAAEMLAHHSGLRAVGSGSFDGGARASRAYLLEQVGQAAVSGFVADGSGLSRLNQLSADVVVEVLADVWATGQQQWLAAAGTAIAGFTGTLADRFGLPATAAGLGVVRAKTGTLTGVNALAGMTVTAAGDVIVFAFLANDTTDAVAAVVAMDTAAARLSACVCR